MLELRKGPRRPNDDWAPSVVRLIFFSALTVLLVAMGTFFPLLSFWGLLLCPLPLALLGCREGPWWAGGGVIVACGGLGLLSPSLALYFLMSGAPVSMALALLTGTRLKGDESLLVCTLVSLTGKLAALAVFWALTGRNLLVPDANLAASLFQAQNPEQALALQEALQRALDLLPHLTPSLVLLYAGLDSALNYGLCARLSAKMERRLAPLQPFAAWRFPRSLLPALLFSYLLGVVLKPERWLEGAMFAINLRLVLSVLFYIQGAALAIWWLQRRRVGPFLRFLALFLMLLPVMWLWLILLGVVDMLMDFRARAGNA